MTTPGIGQRGRWVLVFVGFFLVFGAWSFAAPYDGPPDEVQHAIRAAGVVSGQIAPKPEVVLDGQNHPGMGAYQRVPGGLLDHAECWGFTPSKSAACARPLSGGPVKAVPTSAGRYNPLYYALVGAPLRLAPNWAGLVLSRLISSALSAALLAFSFMVLSRWSRFGLMFAGLIAAATPMLAHLAGAVNPNGLEIAAGIGLFSAGIPLLLGPPRGSRKQALWLLGISAVLLATLRSLGPMWVGFALFALLVPQSRASLRRLWGQRLVRRWSYVTGLAFVLSVAWIYVMKTGALVAPSGTPHHYTVTQAIARYVANWGNTYLDGLVGVAGWFDISMPSPFYWAYIAVAGSLVVLALATGSWSERWRFFVIFVGGVVAPGVMQVAEANTVGFIIGGRYMLPLLVSMPLLGAFIVERRVVSAQQAHSLTKFFIVMLLPMHMVLLVYAMVRWQKGVNLTHLNPLAGTWHPPTGSVLPLVLMTVGLLMVSWMTWNAPRRAAVLSDVEAEQAVAVAAARAGHEDDAGVGDDADADNNATVGDDDAQPRGEAAGSDLESIRGVFVPH